MFKNQKWTAFFLVFCVTLTPGCALTISPQYVDLEKNTAQPILKLGEVTETTTGTWSQYPGAGFRTSFLKVLNEPGPQSLFSSDPSNLTLNIHLTNDHEADGPRLTTLGMASVFTFGIIPLPYNSVWQVQCDVTLVSPEGKTVADYTFNETGRYDLWVFPPTMFALLFSGLNGDQDGKKMERNTCNSLFGKIMKAIDNDYPKLANYVGVSPTGESHASEKPLIV